MKLGRVGVFFVALVTNVFSQDIDSTVQSADTLESPRESEVEPVLQDEELIQKLEDQENSQDSTTDQDELDSNNTLKPDASKVEKGSVRGIVLDRDKQSPLKGVTVIYSSGAKVYRGVTSSEGLYSFGVIGPGSYDVDISKKGYRPYKKTFMLGSGGEVREVRLEKRIPVARMIEVKQPRKQGSAMDLRKKRANTSGVVEGMSAEQIAKSTDSDAGSLARRVTGTSLVGGRYVFVRGLGERYTNMTFNGLPISSPEKDKRVVPQDLFPASALESFTISKTFTPELMSDFAGGSIGLTTRGVPPQDVDKVSVGVTARDFQGDEGFTNLGQDYYTYQGGSLDYFGFDDGTRSLPDGVPNSISRFNDEREDIADYASRFNNYWKIDSAGIQPNTSYSYTHARVFKKDSTSKQGYMANVSFKNSFNSLEYTQFRLNPASLQDENGDNIVDTIVRERLLDDQAIVLDTSRPNLQYVQKGIRQDFTEGSYKTTLAAMLNYGWNNRNNVFWSKNFFANLSQDRVRRNRSLLDRSSAASQDTDLQEVFSLEYTRRHLLTHQIGGGHYIGVGVLDSMSWASGFTWTQGESPDSRNYLFTKNYREETIEGVTTTYLPESHNYETKNPFGTRSYEDFGEYNVSGRADFYLHIPPPMDSTEQDGFWKSEQTMSRIDTSKYKVISFWELPSAQTGVMGQYRARSFDFVRYDYRRDGVTYSDENGSYDLVEEHNHPDSVANFVLTQGQGFRTASNDYDTYTAGESQFATYLQTHLGFKLFDILTGVHTGFRMEYHNLEFEAPFTGSTPVPAEDSVRAISSTSLTCLTTKIVDRSEEELDGDPGLSAQKEICDFGIPLEIYPSVSLDFEFFPRTKTRFIYSQTLVRPEMRERAPTVFFDTENSVEIVGNPKLEDTKIQHYDMRFDYDLTKGQYFSFSLFYKDFEKPIESFIDANAIPGIQRLQNAAGAKSYGFETEIDLKANSLVPGEKVDRSFLKDISMYVNYAWIRSKVELDTMAPGVSLLTSRNRPMIGQSPYLFNSKLTHEIELKGKSSILNSVMYNVVGPRIEFLGTDGNPDIYRDPFPSLDYIHRIKLGSHSISLKLKNLLYSQSILRAEEFNHELEYQTTSNERRDELYKDVPRDIIMRTPVGMTVGLSYSYDFQ